MSLKKLKYLGTGPVVLPEGLGNIRPGDTTPPLPKHIYDGLVQRPDFKAAKSRKTKTEE